MYRKANDTISKWLKKKNRKPLLLRGARQVGKSTLVRLAATENNFRLIEINLELHRELRTLFIENNIEKILLSIISITRQKIDDNSIVFLDEIQAIPEAIASLRYFYELKPEIPVIAAGSLIEFTLSKHEYSMPVGRIEYLFLGPMTFLEFLKEVDSENYELLTTFSWSNPFPEPVHRKLLEYVRSFMAIGGMPEAVKSFTSSRNINEVISVQNSICNTYIDDFSKYAQERELHLLQQIFKAVPRQAGTVVKYSHLLPDEKSTHTKNRLDLLIKAQVIRQTLSTAANGVPLSAESNEKFRKLYFIDIGLSNRLLQLDTIDFFQFSDHKVINEGSLAEQFICQHLYFDDTFQTPSETFFWMNTGKNTNAEIDFVINRGSFLFPIEVKSGSSGTLKSLHYFMYQKQKTHAVRFDCNTPSCQEITTTISLGNTMTPSKYTLLSLPLYAVELLPEMIDKIRTAHTAKQDPLADRP